MSLVAAFATASAVVVVAQQPATSSRPAATPGADFISPVSYSERLELADRHRVQALTASRSYVRRAIPRHAPKPRLAPAGRRVRASYPSVYAWAHSRDAVKVYTCESHGNPGDRSNPRYRGKWQFAWSTWASVGGSGDPASASEAEQDYRAWLLWRRDGWSPWECARITGVI